MTGTADLVAAPSAPAPPAPADGRWRRLDPRTLLIRIVTGARLMVLLVVQVLLMDHTWDRITLGYVPVALGAGLVVLLAATTRWLSTLYRVTDEVVELRTGLLARKLVTLRRDRIRAVDITAGPVHRLLRVHPVEIGSGDRDRMALDALSAQDARLLRRLLLSSRTPTPAAAPPTVLATMRRRWLRYAPLSISGFVVVGSMLSSASSVADLLDHDTTAMLARPADPMWRSAHPTWWVWLPAAALVALLLALAFSMAIYAVRYGNFRLSHDTEGTLRVRHGLLTRRSASVSRDRLRGVVVIQRPLLRPARGAVAYMVATGLGRGEALLMPPAPLREVHDACGAALGLDTPPSRTPLRGHPRAALRLRLVRFIAPTLLLNTPAVLLAPTWLWPILLVVTLVTAALLAADGYRALGHALTDHHLVTRTGVLRRRTAVVQRTGIVGWTISQSWAQRRAGLITLGATTAAGVQLYRIVDVGQADGLALADQAVPGLLGTFLQSTTRPDGRDPNPKIG